MPAICMNMIKTLTCLVDAGVLWRSRDKGECRDGNKDSTGKLRFLDNYLSTK